MCRTYGGRRSRVRIDARTARANMRAALHIQHRRPNDRAYRAPNWNKHSLGQWVELMGVGDPECALMCARKRARSTTHTALAPEGLDRLNPKFVQKPIGAMGTSFGGRRARTRSGAANPRERGARERALRARVQGWNRAQQLPLARSSSVGSADQNKIVGYSQTDTGARTSDPAQPNFCSTPD
jgi:hypothetical protein